jgi:hypothetical protein
MRMAPLYGFEGVTNGKVTGMVGRARAAVDLGCRDAAKSIGPYLLVIDRLGRGWQASLIGKRELFGDC